MPDFFQWTKGIYWNFFPMEGTCPEMCLRVITLIGGNSRLDWKTSILAQSSVQILDLFFTYDVANITLSYISLYDLVAI